MTVWISLALAGWLTLILFGLFFGYRLRQYRNRLNDLEFRHRLLVKPVAEVQRSLTVVEGKLGMRDGEVVRQITENLDAELERSANLTEMRRAKRRHLPRENAGPPAKVSRLRLNRK